MQEVLTQHLSPAEYLAWEEQQEEKHEYENGRIYAMAGASENHIIITDTVFLLITGYNSNPFHRCMDNSPIPQNL